MNKERLLEIAADLRAPELLKVKGPQGDICPHFNMRRYVHTPESDEPGKLNYCGTTCCIGGLAVLKWVDSDILHNSYRSTFWYFSQAQKLLELTHEQAENLFAPGVRIVFDDTPPGTVDVHVIDNNKLWAARCIERLVLTGEVNWVATRNG